MGTGDTTGGTPGGVAVYMRVSSDEQKAQGTIETQRAVLERWLAAQGMTAAGWYEDEAWSGYSVAFADRPAGRRLMADITAGRITSVLVRKLDRFGRNAREILNAVHALEAAGAQLVSLKENVDTRTSAGRFFLTVLAGVAELERDMIVERSEEGMARRLTETTWMGGHPPYGYRVEGRKRDARLVVRDTPDPDDASGYSEADVVRLCWHLLVEQDWAVDRVAERLVELGIPTRRRGEGLWAPGVVYRLLTDATYGGERTYRAKDGTLHTQRVPAILTREQVDRARATLAEHRRYARTRATGAHPYLLRGLLRCAECGALYTTSWATLNGGKGKRWRYYACSTRHFRTQYARRMRPGAAQDCIGQSVDAEELEAAIWADITTWAQNPGAALHLLAARRQAETGEMETVRQEAAKVQADRDALQAERDKLLTLYRKGIMTETDVTHQLAALADEEADLRRKADKLDAKLRAAEVTDEHLQSARTLLQQLHARLANEPITPELQREVVEALVVEIRVETVDVGLSVRGRMKRQAKVHVTYAFEPPSTDATPATVPAASEDGITIVPAWRWS